MSGDRREILADIQHEIWASWMEYLFSVCTDNLDGSVTIPASSVNHWQRQIATRYIDLSEREKDSDREHADKIMRGENDDNKRSGTGGGGRYNN